MMLRMPLPLCVSPIVGFGFGGVEGGCEVGVVSLFWWVGCVVGESKCKTRQGLHVHLR